MDNSQSQSMNQEGPTEAPPKLPEGWLGKCFKIQSRAMSDILVLQRSGKGLAESSTMCNELPVIHNGRKQRIRKGHVDTHFILGNFLQSQHSPYLLQT